MTGTTSLLSLGLSLTNASSLVVIWLISSQMRLLLLLVLTKAYMPKDVKDYILGFEVFSFDFSFVSAKSVPPLSYLVDWLDHAQPEDVLTDVGVESTSSLANLLDLFVTLAAVILAHAS